MPADPAHYNVILRGGTIYDGSGGRAYVADVGLSGDRIAAVGDLGSATAALEIDVRGLAVAPGFINMLSWATESLLADGNSQSDIRQGVTLEIFGEGHSMGPLSPKMRKGELAAPGGHQIRHALDDAGGILDPPGAAAAFRATSRRSSARPACAIHALGYENRPPTRDELEHMRRLVRQEMQAGALGIGSSLIYAPAFYAKTDELIELCKVAAEFDGLYISHIRSEGNKLLEGVDELIHIAREARIPAEIYHLKAAGQENWPKHEAVVAKIEKARAEGLRITADMYTYTAGATGLDAAMPPWVQEGGYDRWRDRLRDPATRAKVAAEMKAKTDDWENLLLAAGSPDRVLLVEFKNDGLKHLTGQDARRSRQAARQIRRRDRDGPRDRGRQPRRDRLFHDERGKRQEEHRPAVGQLLFRLGVAGAGRACS